MNFAELGLDLQSVSKRAYQNIYYQSTFMNLLNDAWMQVARSTGTPIIEVVVQKSTGVNVREGAEITTPLTPKLATYSSVKVDLTELPMDYSFMVSPTISTVNISNTIQGQIDTNDSDCAKKIDIYGYGKLDKEITGKADGSEAYSLGQVVNWTADSKEGYILMLNTLKAYLFNRNISSGYLLGLAATEYAKFVSNLTSLLKYETRTGVEGVDKGVFGNAYGVDTFQINDSVLGEDVAGYFANKVGCVGDMYFNAMTQYNGNYPGRPGYFVVEGNILFGAKVVRPEAIIKLAKVTASA